MVEKSLALKINKMVEDAEIVARTHAIRALNRSRIFVSPIGVETTKCCKCVTRTTHSERNKCWKTYMQNLHNNSQCWSECLATNVDDIHQSMDFICKHYGWTKCEQYPHRIIKLLKKYKSVVKQCRHKICNKFIFVSVGTLNRDIRMSSNGDGKLWLWQYNYNGNSTANQNICRNGEDFPSIYAYTRQTKWKQTNSHRHNQSLVLINWHQNNQCEKRKNSKHYNDRNKLCCESQFLFCCLKTLWCHSIDTSFACVGFSLKCRRFTHKQAVYTKC